MLAVQQVNAQKIHNPLIIEEASLLNLNFLIQTFIIFLKGKQMVTYN